MPINERQYLITRIAERALKQPAEIGRTFSWLKNRHEIDEFGPRYLLIEEIYGTLGGLTASVAEKKSKKLNCDVYFGGEYNFILEFDEFQHFSTAREIALSLLPKDLNLGFDKEHYLELCRLNNKRADNYRKSKKTVDFNFIGCRTAQRAYFDTFRDILPTLHGLCPTVRISEFEVASISSDNADSRQFVRQLIQAKALNALPG